MMDDHTRRMLRDYDWSLAQPNPPVPPQCSYHLMYPRAGTGHQSCTCTMPSEDVPQARGLMSEDIPDPLARGYRHMRGGWPGIAASSRHCPVCLADHSDITAGQACPDHGHLLQPWAGALECPARRCAYSRPVSPNA